MIKYNLITSLVRLGETVSSSSFIWAKRPQKQESADQHLEIETASWLHEQATISNLSHHNSQIQFIKIELK